MIFRAGTAAEVLAIVLCPAGAFARGKGQRAQAAAVLRPVKREIVRRFWAGRGKT
jgi:hypothetical protein